MGWSLGLLGESMIPAPLALGHFHIPQQPQRTQARALSGRQARRCRISPWLPTLVPAHRGHAKGTSCVAALLPARSINTTAGTAVYALAAAEQLTGAEFKRPYASGAVLGPHQTTVATYSTSDRRDVLAVSVGGERFARWAWLDRAHGAHLPGIGDDAFACQDHAAVRAGNTTVVITLLHDASGHAHTLQPLLATAAARLSCRMMLPWPNPTVAQREDG